VPFDAVIVQVFRPTQSAWTLLTLDAALQSLAVKLPQLPVGVPKLANVMA
jgi:hypothetical protein